MTFLADPAPFGPFTKGVNNRQPSFALGTERLRNGVNIDIDNTGHVHRRAGATKVVAGAAVRSLWFEGESGGGYFADGTSLMRFDPSGLPPYQAGFVATVTAAAAIAYCKHQGSTYWSDGVLTGQLVKGVNQSWGIAPPTSQVGLALTTGNLNDGTYQITYTYVRANGEESGADIGAQIVISHTDRTKDGTGGIIVTGIITSTDPTVVAINVYCTAPNGGALMRVATVPNAAMGDDTAMYTSDSFGQQLATQFVTPAPAGSIIASHGSRIYVAVGNFLFYSDPFAPGWFSQASNFIPFGSPIAVVLPVKDGMFVCTTEQMFYLNGFVPEKANLVEVLPYGAVPGSGVTIKNDTSVAWMTPRGIVIGGPGGVVKAVQEDEIAVELASAGILGYREVNGMRHLVAILTGTRPSGMVHKDFTEQEARRINTNLPLG